MKKISMTIISCLLAVMFAIICPLNVLAQTEENTEAKGKYISEVKIGMGKTAAEASAALAGYTILSDKNGNIDLNQNAGGGWGSKGEKVVYLGYKTTDDKDDAITDLAVMNMKGGYSVKDYKALFKKYISEQIEPMVDRFVVALEEYRANFSSENEDNRLRAAYIHKALNKYIDDDTGKGLGDLFLNRTKYEMGDAAYDALSDIQKKNTADIVTIFCQANGSATLMIENLVTRAADTSDDTWVDRLASTTYDELLDDICDEQGLLPSDAENELARLYDDGARKVRALWNGLSSLLSQYDASVKLLEDFDFEEAGARLSELEDIIQPLEERDDLSADEAKALEDARNEHDKLSASLTEAMNAVRIVTVREYLDQFEYQEGTLADFFSKKSAEVSDKELYPVAASFSDGQMAGLDFVSLLEMVIIALTDGSNYDLSALDEFEEASIYDGVDRGIYEYGGVALTNDSLRTGKNKYEMIPQPSATLFFISSSLTCVSFFGMLLSFISVSFPAQNNSQAIAAMESSEFLRLVDNNGLTKVLSSGMTLSKKLAIGFTVATVVLAGLSVLFYYMDLVEYYDVEFTPIPQYIVDEKDITAYNAKGEKIFIKNQTAYYKLVECNRTAEDERFKMLGVGSDLNGDVGMQWLALYSVKQEGAAPILAGSLTAVIGKADIPANYTTGIHMFGSDTAFDINNQMYIWNGDAPSVYVYFNVDDTVKRSAVGSIIADGETALAGGIGIIIGALAAFAVMSLGKRKKEETEAL